VIPSQTGDSGTMIVFFFARYNNNNRLEGQGFRGYSHACANVTPKS